ncbi:hypothetical protein pb186bvf_002163 [Paramecium bursaria]
MQNYFTDLSIISHYAKLCGEQCGLQTQLRKIKPTGSYDQCLSNYNLQEKLDVLNIQDT